MFAANVELPNSDQYRTYATQQIRYMLGENKRQSSYVIGIGRNPPQRPHHRGRYSYSFMFNFLMLNFNVMGISQARSKYFFVDPEGNEGTDNI